MFIIDYEMYVIMQKDENVGTGLVGAPACGDVMVCSSFIYLLCNKIIIILTNIIMKHPINT